MDSIKECIKKENYTEALDQCEELLKDKKYENNYQLLSFLSLCALKIDSKEDRAIYALETLLTLKDTPLDQHQKIWKHLSQLYETKNNISKVITANTQLYIMMKEKGNTERMLVLADIIIDNYLKVIRSSSTTLSFYQIGWEFICNHIISIGIIISIIYYYHHHYHHYHHYLFNYHYIIIINRNNKS